MSDASANGILSREEQDTFCEITSIAMGAAGSTLALLVGSEVDIPTPTTTEYSDLASMQTPFGEQAKTLIAFQYAKGIQASALFVLQNEDVRRLAGMMLGAPESSGDEPLTEMEVGAIGELMNQIMNSAATGLASVMHEPVEITGLEVMDYTADAISARLPESVSEPIVVSSIQLRSGGADPFEIKEIRLSSEVKTHVEKMMAIQPDAPAADNDDDDDTSASISFGDFMAETSQPARTPTGAGVGGGGRSGGGAQQIDPVTVRPVEFASFDQHPHVYGEENKNLELVMDVTLNLSVELGKTELSIKDVLELTRGSVIELDRVAGEPVDLLANGKLIAKGEVVVIEDNFGLRITSIVAPADRLRGL